MNIEKTCFSAAYIKDKISIIIPTYNRFDFLMNAIHSTRNQDYVNKETIVVDDASTDERYISYNWKDIIYKRLDINNRKKYNVGCANGITRNEGIFISSGEYLAFLDDDDYYLDNKLSYQLECMKKYGYMFSSSNMFYGYGRYHNKINKQLYFKNSIGIKIGEGLYEFDYETIKEVCFINLSSVMIHRNIIEEFGGFEFGTCEDYKFWKKIIGKYKCLYLEKPTIYYDMNHGNGKLYDEI